VRRHGGLQVHQAVAIGRQDRFFRQFVGDAHAPGPAAAPVVQVLPDEDRVHVGVGVVGSRRLAPVQIDPDDCLLHKIIGAVPVLAEQEREST
jgi:hypothetical protein